jgi:hypothetical protein
MMALVQPVDKAGMSGWSGSLTSFGYLSASRVTNPASRGGAIFIAPASATSIGSAMFRISGKDDFLVDVETVKQIEPVIRSSPHGRYHVDEMSTRRLPYGRAARRWGVATKRSDAAVTLDPAASFAGNGGRSPIPFPSPFG